MEIRTNGNLNSVKTIVFRKMESCKTVVFVFHEVRDSATRKCFIWYRAISWAGATWWLWRGVQCRLQPCYGYGLAETPACFPQRVCSVLSTTIYVAQLPHTTASTVRTPHAVLGCKELRKGAGKTRAQHVPFSSSFGATFLVPPLCCHEVCVHAWKTESGNLEFACCFFAIKWEFEQMRVWGPKPYSLE